MRNKKIRSVLLFLLLLCILQITVSAETNPKAWQKINGVCYNGSGVAIPKAITRGIDVSFWQGEIDWKKVKADNVDFAFIRAAYGDSSLDSKYDENMKNAIAAGMPVGVYIFSTALTEEQALKEAQLTIRKLQGYKISYPVVIDLEYSSMTSLSKEKVGKIALAFCNEIKKAGYYPMVYCNAWWYRDIIDWKYLKGIDVWLADYGDTIMAPSTSTYKYTIWQSTSGMGELNSTKGLIDGISPYNFVDINFGFVDYTKIITPRRNSFASYSPSAEYDLTIDLKVNGELTPTPESKNGWEDINGSTYYYRNNKKLKGWQKIDGKYYYFNTSKGFLYKDKLLISNKNNVCYVDKNGVRVRNQWVSWKGRRYYIGSYGYALKNFQTVDGSLYYFNKKYGYTYKNRKLTSLSGNVYYAMSNGVIYTKGFLTINENGRKNTYYFNKNGKAQKGWKKLGSNWYYFTSNKGIMRKSCTVTTQYGNTYVFNSRGICISGKV